MYEMEGPRWQHRTLTADHSAATSDEATASFEGPIKVPVSRLSKRPRVSPEMASAFRGEAFLLPLAGRAQGVSVHLSKILSSSTGQMPFIPRIGPLSTDYPHVNAQEQWNRARPLRSEAAAGRTPSASPVTQAAAAGPTRSRTGERCCRTTQRTAMIMKMRARRRQRDADPSGFAGWHIGRGEHQSAGDNATGPRRWARSCRWTPAAAGSRPATEPVGASAAWTAAGLRWPFAGQT